MSKPKKIPFQDVFTRDCIFRDCDGQYEFAHNPLWYDLDSDSKSIHLKKVAVYRGKYSVTATVTLTFSDSTTEKSTYTGTAQKDSTLLDAIGAMITSFNTALSANVTFSVDLTGSTLTITAIPASGSLLFSITILFNSGFMRILNRKSITAMAYSMTYDSDSTYWKLELTNCWNRDTIFIHSEFSPNDFRLLTEVETQYAPLLEYAPKTNHPRFWFSIDRKTPLPLYNEPFLIQLDLKY